MKRAAQGHFSISKRLNSFVHAFRGAGVLLTSQHNAWIHLVITIGVIGGGIFLGFSLSEWMALSLSIGLVWCAEALNTAIELLGDEISLERRERIGQAKDVAAFAVLVSAVSAIAVGVMIFGSHLFGQK